MEHILKHQHLVVRAEVNKPPFCPEDIKLWLLNLIDKIGMKVLLGPYAVYSDMPGNEGLTAVVIIETSHLVLHVWDSKLPGLVQFDCYSCSELNPSDVLEALQVFEPIKVEYSFIDRENNLTILDMKEMNFG